MAAVAVVVAAASLLRALGVALFDNFRGNPGGTLSVNTNFKGSVNTNFIVFVWQKGWKDRSRILLLSGKRRGLHRTPYS